MKLINAVAGIALAFTFATPALADATVKVDLWDKGGDMDMSAHMGLGMNADMSMATMGITVDQASVPAGKVTFDVTNVSKEAEHEMIVAPIADMNVVLPYNADENRVDEDAYGDLGEVSELEPGASGSLTINLKPGLYILYCNIPGHYMAGMWTTIEVK
jgi:uncharacterized cupredoxin-like copper-binding protein